MSVIFLQITIDWLSDNFFVAVLSGFFSSIFATIFIWFFYSFLKSYIIPRYQATVYQGVLIDGKWINEIKNPDSNKGTEGTLILSQNGAKLLGTLSLKNIRPDSPTFIISYEIEGEVRNNQVFLWGKPRDRHKMSFVAGLFKIKNGGNLLLGCSVGTDNYDGEIFSHTDVSWKRVS